MKKLLTYIAISLFAIYTLSGQNLFLIGESSYPSSETFALQSNSDLWYVSDLSVVFAKGEGTPLFAVKTKTPDLVIRGKLMIYLDDASVIVLNDRGNYDYVDQIASAVYYLTKEDLNKLESSNINTIRYSLVYVDGYDSPYDGNYSASNKSRSRIDFPTIISEFFEDFKVHDNTKGLINRNRSNVNVYGEGSGTGTEGVSFDLAGRQPRSLPKPEYDRENEGIVVVEITVDRNGNVINARPGVRGSSNINDYFLKVSKEAALKSKFDKKPDAPSIQKGTITYHFILR